MSKHKFPYSTMITQANEVREFLTRTCERIEIAGSLRRQAPEVGDIELVAIPKQIPNLLGEPSGKTEIDMLFADIPTTKNGAKYKQFKATPLGIQVDLFLATPDNFGLIYMLRTGDAEFSHKMVTRRSWGGYMPDHIQVKKGQVLVNGVITPVPEEQDLFRLWRMDYVEPAARTGEYGR